MTNIFEYRSKKPDYDVVGFEPTEGLEHKEGTTVKTHISPEEREKFLETYNDIVRKSR